jgi:uncharacterized protein
MTELAASTVYFGQPGPANTDRTLELVQERARTLGITTVLVATTSGATGLKAAQLLVDLNVVAVTHSAGFSTAYKANHDPGICDGIRAAGGQVLTTTHAFGGVGRAVRKKLATYQVDEIIAYTLRCFGQGMKVVAEITLMASDGGVVPSDAPIIAVGGSGKGADTAVIIQPTHAQTFFDLRYLEIICMPAPGHPGLGG